MESEAVLVLAICPFGTPANVLQTALHYRMSNWWRKLDELAWQPLKNEPFQAGTASIRFPRTREIADHKALASSCP